MNLPNRLTMLRIGLAILIIVILLFPFYTINISFPDFKVEDLIINSKYILAGILFVIASITDYLDGYLAKKHNLVTDFGKMFDSIADKILVNPILIILSAKGLISPVIPVVIITRDIITNAIKMMAGNKGTVVAAIQMGRVKTACMLVGITLTFFYNLPFEFYNLRIADFFLIAATLLSIVSGGQYYLKYRKIIFKNN